MDSNLLKLIESDVKRVLPLATDESAKQIAEKLVAARINLMSNLKYVKEEEISDIIGVYDARSLIAAWKSRDSGGNASTSRPVDPSASVALGERLRHCSYKVNWNNLKLSNKICSLIEEKKVLDSTQLDKCVRKIVAHVKETVPNVKRSLFKSLSEDIVQEYPCSFKDIMVKGKAGKALTTDAEKLTYKMNNRYDNTNRQDKTPLQKEAPNIPQAVGCVRWSVTSLPDGEDEDTVEGRIVELQLIFQEESPREWDWDKIEENMIITFGIQRAELNSQVEKKKPKKRKRRQQEDDEEAEEAVDDVEEPPAVKTTNEIIHKFPFLMHPKGMNIHFEELTKKCFLTSLCEWLDEVEDTMVDFLATKHDDNPRVRHLMRKAKDSKSCDEDDAAVMAILIMIINSLHEKKEFLFKCVRPGTKIHEVQEQHTISPNPCIYPVGTSIFESKKFYFSLDEDVRCSVKSFRSALLLFFCSFFVFNILFHEDMANTLDFIQRAILNIDPKGQSRVPKKKRGRNNVAYAVHMLNTQYRVYEQNLEKEK